MALGGGVQAIDGVRGDLHRGVEPEREVGAGEVVVDGLGHADHAHAVLGVQPAGGAEGVLAADGHEGIQAQALEARQRGLGRVVVAEGVCARALQHGAPAGEDAAHVHAGEGHGIGLQQPLPAAQDSQVLVAMGALANLHHRADDGIESGAVAPSGQDPHAHAMTLSAPGGAVQPAGGGCVLFHVPAVRLHPGRC
jgi:hypothetical protein